METDTTKSSKADLNLAPHEWASLYKLTEPITKNGSNSIRHLEGCIHILLEAIENRYREIKSYETTQ